METNVKMPHMMLFGPPGMGKSVEELRGCNVRLRIAAGGGRRMRD